MIYKINIYFGYLLKELKLAMRFILIYDYKYKKINKNIFLNKNTD